MSIQSKGKQYHHTGTMVSSCQYHVVFCPKYRKNVLVNGIDRRLKELIREQQGRYGYRVLDMEVMPDHVHLLLDISANVPPHEMVYKLKGFVSYQLRKEFPFLKTSIPTLWTRSCFISSVGAVTLEIVKRYIQNQKYA
ncbi:MAG: IS200/IS605 family transposase [bacterium]